KKNRVLKERERRARETVAFKNLRHALEVTDPHTFWRMERVDIVEGANLLLKQRIGDGGTVDSYGIGGNTKIDRVLVEKKRRARESEAVKNLKKTMMKY
ncbi:hypothetical protein PFISCL1PPCAC_7438, partial [Pristionchus fissidentatus]